MHEKSAGAFRKLVKIYKTMRRIEYIAPVAAIRGNLSGNQALLYPTRNNSAWDSPSNKRNYATNYTPRYIGAKRSRDGHTFFAVKQRSAVTMSDAMRNQQAFLGGTKAIYDALIHNPLTIGRMQALYLESPERNSYGWSMYKWAYSQISGQLGSKIAGIRIIGKLGGTPLVVQNPWISTTVAGAVTVTISADVLAKFWMQLANNPVEFTVNGAIGVAHSDDDFSKIITSGYNVLDLSVGVGDKVKLGELWLCYDSEGVKKSPIVDDLPSDAPNSSYYLSETAGA